MITRTDIINALIYKFGYKTYLEIGVRNPDDNFNSIRISDKEGVDPAGNCKHQMTSDEFFSTNKKIYDIVFIDGLHLDYQVWSDINNSLKYLASGGTIVCHDMNPIKEEHQTPKYNGGTWNGTGWKAWADIRMVSGAKLNMFVVDADHGCGIIQRGEQKLFPWVNKNTLNYAFLEENRKELLNLISVQEFREWVKK